MQCFALTDKMSTNQGNKSLICSQAYTTCSTVCHYPKYHKVCIMLHSELSRKNTCTAVYLSLLDRSGSIQTKVGVAMVVKKDFQNI